MVACFKPNRIDGRYGFANASRMHTHGVYLDKENARRRCNEMNAELEKSPHVERLPDGRLRYKNHVISYKVRDYKERPPYGYFGQRSQPCGDCDEMGGKFYCTMNCSGGAA